MSWIGQRGLVEIQFGDLERGASFMRSFHFLLIGFVYGAIVDITAIGATAFFGPSRATEKSTLPALPPADSPVAMVTPFNPTAEYPHFGRPFAEDLTKTVKSMSGRQDHV